MKTQNRYRNHKPIGLLDDFRFRMEPGNFEKMRSNYQYRREFYVE